MTESFDRDNNGSETAGDLESLQDRLTDRALCELFGERPPSLSARILAVAEQENLFEAAGPIPTEEKVMNDRESGKLVEQGPRRRRWPLFVTAACMLVVAGVLVAVYLHDEVQTAREASTDLAQRELSTKSETGNVFAHSSDGGPREAPSAPLREAPYDRVAEPAGTGAADNGRPVAGASRLPQAPQADTFSAPPTTSAVPQVALGERIAIERKMKPAAAPDGVRAPFDAAPTRPGEGRGPGVGGDKYSRIIENPFAKVTDHPLSTFSIDVDTASYANVRSFLLQQRMLPPPDAVRIEEFVNYFTYDYAGPNNDDPFAANIEVAACPWEPKHRLVRIAIKGKAIDRSTRPLSNLVFLIDVSGSMQDENKLPLLKQGMKMLAEQLGENDQVAIVVYASAEGLVLPSTNGSEGEKIIYALENLNAGGSTNGGAGIELAYRVAQQHFIRGGVNRIILCTDGDFNVGTTSTAALERLAEERAKSGVFLTVLGFGRGNLNDAMMETISNKGNGNYAYIDGPTEARKVLVEQMSGTLVTIAKDVKIQVEFNPAEVFAYRLIGYENRMLAAEDFNDDRKDAGEIGAGHTVTALYELVPRPKDGEDPDVATGDVDDLKYQRPGVLSDVADSGELLTLKLRYKQPDGEVSRLLQFPVKDDGQKFGQASTDFKFASSVAAFGMLLRGSKYAGNSTIDAVLEIAQSSKGEDKYGYRAEFVELAREAKRLGK